MARYLGAVAALVFVAVAVAVSVDPAASAEPPGCPQGALVDADGCSARLIGVSADSIGGTLTGTPAGGLKPITIFGEPGFYLPSAGFGDAPPDAVQQWDATIDRVRDPDPSDPGWYGHAKADAFLPRQLNELATQFPPSTLLVRFALDDTDAHVLTLRSIQPVR